MSTREQSISLYKSDQEEEEEEEMESPVFDNLAQVRRDRHFGTNLEEAKRKAKRAKYAIPGNCSVLNWENICSPKILRTIRRTMIRFLIELLVRRTWFRQFDELYFVLNWLVMRCKLRPELAVDAPQTA